VHLNRPAYPRQPVSLPRPGESYPVRGIVRPAVSPDGASIAFTALGDLWIVAADGGKPRPLTRDAYLDSDPSWSPDGRFLVFASDRAGGMDLWILEVGGEKERALTRLTDSDGAEFGPAWSPDGEAVAYLDQDYNIHILDMESRSSRTVHHTRRWAGLPSWSSDSRHLAVAVYEPFSRRFGIGTNRILIIDTATGGKRTLDLPGRSFGTRDGDGPVWSPDGRKLAFAMAGGLWTLPITPEGNPSGSPRRVADEAADFPAWFPDSKRLLYLAADRVRLLDLNQGSLAKIEIDLRYRVPDVPGRLVIKGVRLIDGTGAAPREKVDIFIDGERIASIEPGRGRAGDYSGMRVVDGAGKTVIPGLIESHTHLELPAWGTRMGRIWLAYGITTVRSPSSPLYRILEEKESNAAARRPGPRIVHTGFLIDGDRIFYPGGLSVLNGQELQRELDRAFKLDYDLIKTYVRLPNELQKMVVQKAHQKGIFVTSHELYPAIAYGIDGIEHLTVSGRRGYSLRMSESRKMYRDALRLINTSGVVLTPTLQVSGGFDLSVARDPDLLQDRRFAGLFPPWITTSLRNGELGEEREYWEAMQPMFAAVGNIARGGGRLIAGTDASAALPFGLTLILEVEQMSEAGLGPLQAIASATMRASEALGIGHELGTVEAGKTRRPRPPGRKPGNRHSQPAADRTGRPRRKKDNGRRAYRRPLKAFYPAGFRGGPGRDSRIPRIHVGAGINGNVGVAQFGRYKGVSHALDQRDVAAHNRNGRHLHLGMAQGHQQSYGIVRSRIRINQ